MDINPVAMDLGQLAIVVAVVWGTMRTHGRKLDVLEKKCAVMEDRQNHTKDDHDRIVMVEASAKRAHERLDEMRISKR